MRPSQLPVAASLPSGLNATVEIDSPCRRSAASGIEIRLPCGQVHAQDAAEVHGFTGHRRLTPGQEQQAVRDLPSFAQRQTAIEVVLGQALVRLPEGVAELFGVPLLPDRVEDRAHHRGRHEDGGHREGRGQGLVAQRPEPAPLQPPHRPCPARLPAQESSQVGGQLAGRGVSAGRLLGEGLQADGLQIARDAIVDAARRPGVLVQELVDDHHPGPAERQLAAQELVEHDPQAVDVAAAVDMMGLAGGLLGTHVRRRADDLAVHRHDGVGLGANGQPEIDQDRPAQPVRALFLGRSFPPIVSPVRTLHHDIGRLDVAMDQPVVVRVVEGLGDLRDEQGALPEGEPALLQRVPERRALDEVGDQDGDVIQREDLVEPHDPRVAELGGDPGLSLHAYGIQAALQGMLMGDLQGDDAIELGIPGAPDRAERAMADPIEQLESADDPDLVDRRALAYPRQSEGVAAFLAVDAAALLVDGRDRMVAARADQVVGAERRGPGRESDGGLVVGPELLGGLVDTCPTPTVPWSSLMAHSPGRLRYDPRILPHATTVRSIEVAYAMIRHGHGERVPRTAHVATGGS